MSRVEINVASGWNERTHATLSMSCFWLNATGELLTEMDETTVRRRWAWRAGWYGELSSAPLIECIVWCHLARKDLRVHTHTHTQLLVQDRGRFSKVNTVSQRSWGGFLLVFIECPWGQHNGKVKVGIWPQQLTIHGHLDFLLFQSTYWQLVVVTWG